MDLLVFVSLCTLVKQHLMYQVPGGKQSPATCIRFWHDSENHQGLAYITSVELKQLRRRREQKRERKRHLESEFALFKTSLLLFHLV